MKGKNRFICALSAFAVASLIALFVINSKSDKALSYADGVWNGSCNGRNGPIQISITLKDQKIVAADIISEKETDFAKPAIRNVLDQAVSKGSMNSFDAVSGATISSKATFEAVRNALDCASGKNNFAEDVKDTSCDIVVIGAGGAGLSASIKASQGGAKVILLEKQGTAGGNTISATGGLNAAETSVQKKLGIADSKDQFYKDTMKGGYNLNNPELVRNMVEEAPETVDWLISVGVDLSDVGKMAGSTNSRTHRPQGGAAVGAHMVPVLEKAAVNAGVDLRKNSKVVDIIKKDGKAAGVIVEKNGKKYMISAKAVIIATGGFGANPDMVVKYKSDLKGFGTTNHKGATGDAFAWIEKFNAGLTQMDQIQTHPTVVPSNGMMITEAVRGNGAIMINREGKRFGSEMATRDVMSAAVLSQTGGTAYLVFDTSVRKSLKAIEGYVKQGLLTEGETPEELAKKLGIPAEALAETIKRYNGFVASGNDGDFGRNGSEMPRALSEGPYFAVEVAPAIHHTMGGIVINKKAEVLDVNGRPVPGLYAAGEVTGGIHGGNRLGGNAVADICVYGKIAADSALEFIQ
ncbi:MAG: flavocytochrome c [Treponema sp.]|nr:flavocytochrome c [Treponema sp.]